MNCKPTFLVVVLLLVVGLPVEAKTKQVKIRGYVTSVTSPTAFEIEDYRITRDSEFSLDFDNASPELKFSLEDVRVGVELEIKGLFNDETGELKAQSIRVDMEQFKKQKQTAILARSPQGLEQSGTGWYGTVSVDGQRIRITPATQVVFRLTNREKDAAKKAKKQGASANMDPEFRPLTSLIEVTAGMEMTYEGVRDPETGIIVAERVEFAHNDLEKGEKKLWESVGIQVKPFNAAQFQPGELKINRVGKFQLVPDEAVQEYITRLGQALIPPYQRELPEADPAKIPFRFFVVAEKVVNAFALPNGVVVVNSGMFDTITNEAQLAAIVGHEIAHAIQEHSWRQREHHKGKRLALSIGAAFAAAYGQNALADMLQMVVGAIQNGYSRRLENQADRLGLEYMISAGYDPREAPRVWKQMAKQFGNAPTDFFWSSHENHATRRSYLMNELKNNYADVDYSALQTGEESFSVIAQRVKAAAAAKRKITVTN